MRPFGTGDIYAAIQWNVGWFLFGVAVGASVATLLFLI